MGGLKFHHHFFSGLIFLLYGANGKLRLLVLLSLPLLLKEVLFDSLRYIPFEWYQPIHIIELYEIDTKLFGMMCSGAIKPINECFLVHANHFLDLFCGFLYHLVVPMNFVVLILLWRFKSKEYASRYAIAFLLMNLFAFATYLLYPAAAPWYVAEHGFAQPAMPLAGDPAGLANFDNLLGMNLSSKIYELSPFVFGAIPSMHAGMTALAWIYIFRTGKKISLIIGIYAIGMWVAALYLQHHYVIDVILGILYAGVAYLIVERILASRVRSCYGFLFRQT